MELFKGKIRFFEANSTDPDKAFCGNPLLKNSVFAKHNYCKNNFNNVISSFILLLELTVVNQWHDILFKAWENTDIKLKPILFMYSCENVAPR